MIAHERDSATSALHPGRMVLALLCAPMPGAIYYAYQITGSIGASLFYGPIGGAIVGWPIAFCVFLPSIMLLVKLRRVTFILAAAAGAVPLLVGGAMFNALTSGPTLPSLFAAAFGMVGGCVFWLIAGDFDRIGFD